MWPHLRLPSLQSSIYHPCYYCTLHLYLPVATTYDGRSPWPTQGSKLHLFHFKANWEPNNAFPAKHWLSFTPSCTNDEHRFSQVNCFCFCHTFEIITAQTSDLYYVYTICRISRNVPKRVQCIYLCLIVFFWQTRLIDYFSLPLIWSGSMKHHKPCV